ncbi:MAG: phosphotransferase [Pseudomonadota bacterium]
MLSSADAGVVARDPAISGLELLLDEAAFLDQLRALLPAAAVEKASRHYIRYKPGMNCLVRYVLEGKGSKSLIYAKAHGPDAVIKLAKAGRRRVATAFPGQGRLLLPQYGVVVSAFPNDSKLNALYRLGEPGQREALFRRILPDNPALHNPRVETLQYKPERRFVACLRGQDGEKAVIKLYGRKGFIKASASAGFLGTVNNTDFPRLLGSSVKHQALVFEWVEGQRLGDFYTARDLDSGWMGELGQRLADFHRPGSGEVLPLRMPGQEVSGVLEMGGTLDILLPELAARVHRLAGEIGTQLQSLTPVSRLLHGDFYAMQVLCAAHGIQFIDSDDVCCGHPAADIGLFLAHVEREVVNKTMVSGQAGQIERSLLDGYSRSMEKQLQAAIELYTATGLLQLLHHPFRNCEPDWPERMEKILAAAERRYERYKRVAGNPVSVPTRPPGASAPVSGQYGVPDDPGMPFLVNALDPVSAARAFRYRLAGRFGSGAEIVASSIQVLRHRPGRRCLIAYEVSGTRETGHTSGCSLVGKVRARGLDKRTWQLNMALHATGFAQGNSDGIEVPEPVGIIPGFNMWLQQRVNGQPAWTALSGNDGSNTAQRMAAAIHKLHAANIPARRTHTIKDEMQVLEKVLADVMASQPQWRGRLERILAASRRLVGKTVQTGLTGIHRDFYHDQVLVDGNRLYLLDLDLYCMGDPALDVGNFIAHLQEQSLRLRDDANALADIVQTLVGHYQQLAGQDMAEAIDSYRILTLVRHIAISQRIKDRRKYTSSLIEVCEQQLGGSRAGLCCGVEPTGMLACQ